MPTGLKAMGALGASGWPFKRFGRPWLRLTVRVLSTGLKEMKAFRENGWPFKWFGRPWLRLTVWRTVNGTEGDGGV